MEKGLLDGELQGSWGGDCGWSGAVLQPGADIKSVVVSPSGPSTQHCDTSEEGRFLQTFCVCQHSFVSVGMEVSL